MRRRKCNILRSRTGASMSLALLLFMICAVVGALVITAGTTAAGRMSNLAQMDQRYYAVSSAAELLANELDGGTVKVTRVREITSVTKTNYETVDKNGRTVAQVVGTPATSNFVYYYTKINDLPQIPADRPEELSVYEAGGAANACAIPDDMSFLTSCGAGLLFDHYCNTDAAMEASMKKNNDTQSGKFTLEDPTDSDNKKGLKIIGSYEVRKDGTIVLLLQNEKGDPFKMRVTLLATINETESETTTDSTDRQYSGSSFREDVTSVTTLTKTSEISWKVSGVEKVVSS